MDRFKLYDLMRLMADNSLAIQERGEKDYINDDGLLVCGECGELKQEMLTFADPTDEDPNHHSEVKVARSCRCERKRTESEEKRAQAEKDAARISALRKSSMMDDRFLDATFKTFRRTKDNAQNYKLCKRYAEKFDLMLERNQGLLMWGGVGTGKTFAAACIANYLLDQMIPVMMTSFVKLISVIQSGEQKDSDIINRMSRFKLVIFDDLGAERTTSYALERVYTIVDERYRQKMPTIFTTNLTVDEMQNETDVRLSRIYDRIFSCCYPVQFTGQSWRRREAGNRFSEMQKLLE